MIAVDLVLKQPIDKVLIRYCYFSKAWHATCSNHYKNSVSSFSISGVAQLISKLNNKPFDESDETLFEV